MGFIELDTSINSFRGLNVCDGPCRMKQASYFPRSIESHGDETKIFEKAKGTVSILQRTFLSCLL